MRAPHVEAGGAAGCLNPPATRRRGWLRRPKRRSQPPRRVPLGGRGACNPPRRPGCAVYALAAQVAVAGLPALALCPSRDWVWLHAAACAASLPPAGRPARVDAGPLDGRLALRPRWRDWPQAGGGRSAGWGGGGMPLRGCCLMPAALPGTLRPAVRSPMPPALPGLALLPGALHAALIPLMLVLGRLPARGARCVPLRPAPFPLPSPALPD